MPILYTSFPRGKVSSVVFCPSIAGAGKGSSESGKVDMSLPSTTHPSKVLAPQ